MIRRQRRIRRSAAAACCCLLLAIALTAVDCRRLRTAAYFRLRISARRVSFFCHDGARRSGRDRSRPPVRVSGAPIEVKSRAAASGFGDMRRVSCRHAITEDERLAAQRPNVDYATERRPTYHCWAQCWK